jgi:PAS domain S-box-containing protein
MKILEAIQDPNSELALLLDSLYDAVYIVDRERVILYWNHAAEQITGFSAAEVLGHSCKDGILNHIDENGKLLCTRFSAFVRMENPQHSAKVYPLSQTGTLSVRPIDQHPDEDGTAVAAIEVFRDITHQEEFRIMQEKFNGLIRKYVSSVTFDEVREQAKGKAGSRASRIVDLTVLYLDVVIFTRFSERNDSTR